MTVTEAGPRNKTESNGIGTNPFAAVISRETIHLPIFRRACHGLQVFLISCRLRPRGDEKGTLCIIVFSKSVATHLKVATAKQKVDLALVHALHMLNGLVDAVQLPMAAAFNGDLSTSEGPILIL